MNEGVFSRLLDDGRRRSEAVVNRVRGKNHRGKQNTLLGFDGGALNTVVWFLIQIVRSEPSTATCFYTTVVPIRVSSTKVSVASSMFRP